jgi:serine/threonine protein kinase
LDDEGYDLLMLMLEVNPNLRITAKQALNHKYLKNT